MDDIAVIPAPTTPKNTPFATLVALKEKHPKISARHLGKLVGISGQAVLNMFSRHGVDFVTGQVTALEEYKVNRADILAIKQVDCLNALTGAKLKNASVRDLTIVFGTLYDKERLERGQSTSNVATILASTAIEAGKQWARKPSETQGEVAEAEVCD